jgi:hypothetical protein
LWLENFKSVAERYPDCSLTDLPGPVGLTLDTIWDYTYAPPQNAPSNLQLLALIACYEYQSCEHPGWEDSTAHHYCTELKTRLIAAVGPAYEASPEYQAIPWEWS